MSAATPIVPTLALESYLGSSGMLYLPSGKVQAKVWGVSVAPAVCKVYMLYVDKEGSIELTEQEFRNWFVITPPVSWGKCECGADKLGHPGHAWYCPKFKGVK